MLSFCQRFIMKIQSDNIGHKTRLRNRFVNEGMENFEPHEVLEVMLYKSFPYSDTNALAHRLIDRFGIFAAVLEAPYTELEKVEGMGRSSAITLSMWREFFRYYERSKRIGRNELCTVDRLPQIASALLKGSVTEEMHVLCLDVKSRLLGTVKISQNSPTFVSATVREIVERAFGFNAAAVAVCHSHPSGNAQPSSEDARFTANLLAVCRQLGMGLSDHVIVSEEGIFSFRRSGVLDLIDRKIGKMTENIVNLNL